MSRNYVDNAYNRRLGRVGMPVGTCVVSRSSGSSSSHGSNSPRTYVDNAFNRREGRVGLEVGTAVISRSSMSSSSNSEPRFYVDNAFNRRMGRAGMEVGTAVVSKSSMSSSSSSQPRTYVDNAFNRRGGRVGLEIGTAVVSKSDKPKSSKVYADNAFNRRLGRAGLPLGSAPHSKNSETPNQSYKTKDCVKQKKIYADNCLNRNLGRVGKQIERTRCCDYDKNYSERNELIEPFLNMDMMNENLIDMYNHIALAREKVTDNQEYYFRCDRAEGIVNRHEVSQVQQYSNLKQPKFLKGEIIKFSELELGEKLGGGGFGDVYVAIWKGVYQVAVKKLRVQKVHRDKKEQFEKEVRLFSSLSHSAIVDFYGACIDTPNLAIVMEFMPNGSLYDALHYESIQFSDKQKFQMIEDVLSALSYLHGLEIAHRDIKSGNILICDDMDHCKLADFGLALKDYSDSSASVADFPVVGTLRYSAPEILDGETLTLDEFMSADIYSVSLTIIELLTEKEPFHSLNQNQIRRAVLDGKRPDFDQPGVPVNMRSILSSGMSEDASDRPSAEEFLNKFKKQLK